MRASLGLAVVLLLGLAVPVLGQQTAGDTELQLQGSVFVGGSGSQDNRGSASVILGRFVSDLQELGINVVGSFVADGKVDGSGGVFYRYNFSTGNVVPYLGVSAGSTFGNSGSDTSTIATAEGGIRFFVDRKTAFTVETSKSYSFKAKEFDKGLTIQFGFSHLWGK